MTLYRKIGKLTSLSRERERKRERGREREKMKDVNSLRLSNSVYKNECFETYYKKDRLERQQKISLHKKYRYKKQWRAKKATKTLMEKNDAENSL